MLDVVEKSFSLRVVCGTGISEPSLRLQTDRLTNCFAFEMRLLRS